MVNNAVTHCYSFIHSFAFCYTSHRYTFSNITPVFCLFFNPTDSFMVLKFQLIMLAQLKIQISEYKFSFYRFAVPLGIIFFWDFVFTQ